MNKNEPLISVIVPVYNGQNYLENCIRSIEAQTYENFEVIIVNDGSTDDTAAVCDRLRNTYDNVRILTLNDDGVSAARNAGVDAAKGGLVTFVDADDRICADMLRSLYECMTREKSDVAGCRFFIWSNEEEWRQGSRPGQAGADVSVYGAGSYLRDEVLCGNSRCWSKLYRREIFDKVRFPEDLTIGEDMLFLVRMLPHIARIAETGYRGYGYYRNPSGAINREFTPEYMDQVKCWQLAREEVLCTDESLDPLVTARYMTGIMLTVGKLAVLPANKRRQYTGHVRLCHEKLKEVMRVPGAKNKLPEGYRLKTGLFMLSPSLYMYLYRLQKMHR